MGLEVDMSELPAGVVEEFRKGRHAREVQTLLNAPRLQDMAARALPVETKSIEGLGRLRMVITPDAFHYWGRRLGYECWRDHQFLREFERDNPAVRVKSRGTRIQVGYTPSLTMQMKFPAKQAAGGLVV
jgi:hypothetical protein